MLQRFVVFVSVIAAVAAASLSAPSTASAQVFSDRAPANAIVFIGWAGTQDHPDFEDSYTELLSYHGELPRRLEQAAYALVPLLQTTDPSAVEHVRLALGLATRVWQKPCGLWVLPGTTKLWQTVFVCEAGDDAEAIMREMEPLVVKLSVRGWSPNLTRAGGTLTLTLNLPQGVSPVAPNQAQSLAAQPHFKAVAKFLRCNGGLAYVNGQTARAHLISHVQATDPAQAARLAAFFETSGLIGVRHAGISLLHEALCWNVDMYIDAPAAGRVGLLGLMAPRPVQKTTFALVPTEATWFAARTLDLRAILTEWRRLRGVLQPGTPDPSREIFGRATGGAALESQLLTCLGDQWVAYTDPTITGQKGLGFVLLNPLRNAVEAKSILPDLAQLFNERWAQQPGSILRIETVNVGGIEIYTLPLPELASPSWAIHNNQLIVSNDPANVASVALAGSPAQPITENLHFKMIQIQLRTEGGPWHSVSYTHLPDVLRNGCESLSLMTDWINAKLGAASQGAFDPPPAPAFRFSVRPTGGVAWSDRNGIFAKSVTPFPGSSLVGPPAGLVSLRGALLASVAWHWLPGNEGGAMDARVSQGQAATRLRELGMLMVRFVDRHHRYPATLVEMFDRKMLNVRDVAGLAVPTEVPEEFSRWNNQKKAAWAEENGSFVVLRWGQEPTYRPTHILAYMRPTHSPVPGQTLLLFADNRTEWLDNAAAAAALREQFPEHVLKDFPAP